MTDMKRNPDDPLQPQGKTQQPAPEEEVDLLAAASKELHPDSDEEFKPIQLADLEEASSELLGPPDSHAEVDIEQAAREMTQQGGAPAEGSGSGASLVSWGELVQEPQESSAVDLGAAPAVKFDALSDIDIVRKWAHEQTEATQEPPTSGPGAAAPLPFTLDEPPRPRGPRATQLAAKGAVHTMLAPAGETLPKEETTAREIPMAAPVAQEPAGPAAAKAAEGSGVLIKPVGHSSKVDLSSDPWMELPEAAPVAPVPGDSGVLVTPLDESSSVNLGSDPVVSLPQAEAPPPQKPRGQLPPRQVEDSGVLVTPPDESSSVDLGSHMDINLLSSGLLDVDESRKGLLPRRADSAINLDEPAAAPPIKPAKPVRVQEEEEVDFLSAEAPAEKESALADDLLGTQEMPAPSSGIDWDKVPEGTTATREPADLEETVEKPSEEMELDEEATEPEAEVAEKPAKKGKKAAKQRKPRRLVSGLVGAVVGAALALGIWTAGYEPPQEWRRQVQPHLQSVQPYLQQAGLPPPKVEPTRGPGGIGSGPRTPRQHLDSGDVRLAMDQVETADPATRGEATWLNYLHGLKGAAPKAEAPEVQKAITDLQAARTPEAYFWLGYIHESTGKMAEARTAYEEGMKAEPDRKQQRKFQAALHRLDLQMSAAPAVGGAQSRATGLDLALILIALQAPAAEAVDDEEAGFKFWEAAKLAQGGDFDGARKALGEAKALHDKRRFQNLRKAQNPLSDPTEEIFRKSCDDLQAYMDVRSLLKNSGYDPRMPASESLKQLAADKKKADDTLATTLKDAAAKLSLKDDMMTPQDILKGITDLADARKKADDELTTLRTELTDAKFVSDSQKDLLTGLKALVKDDKDMATGKKAAEDKLAKVATQLDAAGIKEPELDKGVDKLAAARNDLTMTVGEVAKKLEAGQFIAPKADRDALLKGLEKALAQAHQPLVTALGHLTSHLGGIGSTGAGTLQALDLTGRLAASQGQTAAYLIQVRQSRTPREMLPLWMEALQDSNHKEVLDPATLDAQRVLNDQAATAEEKAEAQALQGLVLRNQGKYDEARKALQAAVKVPAKEGSNFCRKEGARILKELTDPNAHYASGAENLYSAGKADEALAAADTGLAVFPNNGDLLALRAQAKLDQARKSAKKLTAPDVAAAQKDADAAIAAGAVAEGNYAAGLIAEATGDVARAEKNFREALKAHAATDAAGNSYRMALARVLLSPKRPRPVPAEVGDKIGQLDPARLTSFLALLLVAVQADADLDAPPPMPEVEEAIKLADEMIKANDYRGHLIKAQALGKKGIWNTALQEYVEGLRHLIRPEYASGLAYIVDNHPAFRRPDSLRPPDQLQAEKFYGNGLRFYFNRQYPEAERELLEAVRYNDQDARYLYYLGLSRLLQGKRETALEDFRLGAMLEQQQRPSPAAIAGSLERVQGPIRQTLNKYRP